MRSVFLTKYHSGGEIYNSEMGSVCGMYGGQGRFIQCFDGEI